MISSEIIDAIFAWARYECEKIPGALARLEFYRDETGTIRAELFDSAHVVANQVPVAIL